MTSREAFEKWYLTVKPKNGGMPYDDWFVCMEEAWQASRAALIEEIKAGGAYETQGEIICYRLPEVIGNKESSNG